MDSSPQKFDLSKRASSFVYAARGVVYALKTEHNFRIHSAAAAAVVLAGVAFDIGREDWIFVIIAIVLVFVAELINSAIEFLCNIVSPDFHPAVEKAKDIAAGAVLIAAGGAALIGIIVFSSYIIKN